MSTMTVSPLALSPLTVRPATVRAGVGPGVDAAARPPVRLTRRGRLLVTVLAVLVAVTGAVLLTGGASALAGTGGTGSTGGSGSSMAPAERVTVRPGETLWQIAERAAPGADPRETVQRILDLNGLQTSQVQAGTALRLP